MNARFKPVLVVAVSSRALFDFEEENEVFDERNPSAYVALQRQRLDVPAPRWGGAAAGAQTAGVQHSDPAALGGSGGARPL